MHEVAVLRACLKKLKSWTESISTSKALLAMPELGTATFPSLGPFCSFFCSFAAVAGLVSAIWFGEIAKAICRCPRNVRSTVALPRPNGHRTAPPAPSFDFEEHVDSSHRSHLPNVFRIGHSTLLWLC
jgi:hypothetical protein